MENIIGLHCNAGIPFLDNLCPMARVSDYRGLNAQQLSVARRMK